MIFQKNAGRQQISRRVKQMILDTGVIQWIRRTVNSKVPIVMYHRIYSEKDAFFPGVSQAAFQGQMQYLKQHYYVISMDTLLDAWMAGRPLPAKSAVVTFDDGHTQTWELAYPILKELQIPVTGFFATAPMDENGFIWTDQLRWWLKMTEEKHCTLHANGFYKKWPLHSMEDRLRAVRSVSTALKGVSDEHKREAMEMLRKDLAVDRARLPENWLLTWKQIKEMDRSLVTFGSHTQTHPILSRVRGEQAQAEIVESKKRLEEILGQKVRHFAYPNGEADDFTADHERIVKDAGFDSACTSILGLNDPETNRYALYRIYANEEPLADFAARLVGVGS